LQNFPSGDVKTPLIHLLPKIQSKTKKSFSLCANRHFSSCGHFSPVKTESHICVRRMFFCFDTFFFFTSCQSDSRFATGKLTSITSGVDVVSSELTSITSGVGVVSGELSSITSGVGVVSGKLTSGVATGEPSSITSGVVTCELTN
jgi:hypothetical protein